MPADDVVALFLAVETPEECRSFLDAMFSEKELAKLPARWELLKVLIESQVSQRQLSRTKDVAPGTAARAQKAFQRHETFLRTLAARIAEPGHEGSER